jgi:hypothetical protein
MLPKEPEAGPPLAPLAYDGKGRRDPFAPITIVKERAAGVSVSTVKLAGIIRGGRLLALVEGPDGLGYILKPGDVLGDGHVTDITPHTVTFAVAAKPGLNATTVTVKLAGDH